MEVMQVPGFKRFLNICLFVCALHRRWQCGH